MNPLDLRGPEFLLFYLVYGTAVLVALRLWRRRDEGGDGVRVRLSDPYLIAHLRGGRNEALRVAAVALVDRGLLEVRDKELVTRTGVTPRSVRRPIERAVLEHFAAPAAPTALFTAAGAAAEATLEQEQTLVREGLLPDAEQRRRRRGRAVLGVVLLVGLAALKVVVALARGRTNVVFLVLLACVFTGLALASTFQFRTAKGNALLADLRVLFAGLRQRAAGLRPGGATAEVALLMAVFGLVALPAEAWKDARALFRRSEVTLSWDASGTACGASCGGSSCGGGGGCGGGGCGGGCGGCGS